jgi:hypothetical protein
MADTKISALTSASTPLAGTEVLPIVQSGATVKVATNDLTVRNVRANATTGILQVTGPTAASTRVMTVPDANFTAARTDAAQSFTGDQTLSTGNLIQGTAAKGFNFTANTPTAGSTSQLLNWYEEGTWTPNQGSGLTVVGAFSSSGTYTRIGRQVTVTGVVVGATSIAVGNAYSQICSNLPISAVTSGVGSMYNGAATQSGVVFAGGAILYSGSVITASSLIAFSLTYFV